jgi:hypothetical protein
LIDAVDVLHDVGQVEVGGERPDQRDHVVDRLTGEKFVELVGRLCAPTTAHRLPKRPHPLYELE